MEKKNKYPETLAQAVTWLMAGEISQDEYDEYLRLMQRADTTRLKSVFELEKK